MISTADLQSEFFQKIKDLRGGNGAIVDEIAELLSVSNDSAYRRLRGETALTLWEIKELCGHYKISLDKFFGVKSDAIIFNYNWLKPEDFDYKIYLQHFLAALESLHGDCEMIFYAKDFPIFYNFLFPEISEFKGLFWQKTVLQNPVYKKTKFDLSNLDNDIQQLGNQIFKKYAEVPSSELWSDEVLNSAIRQIEFYHESGFMASDQETEVLLDRLAELVDHFQYQAEAGAKLMPHQSSPFIEDNLKLFYNEVIIGDNTLLVRQDERKSIYLAHNIISSLSTGDQEFCEHSWEIQQNLMNRSSLISSSSERERN
ncbi:MAG: hypothetical protein KI790_21195, partial [Cyclobacteriaceae bacterium]|nr:hypothetical protein [Cyclobacteriaceae bacterium HetDA_MAG_MS6]